VERKGAEQANKKYALLFLFSHSNWFSVALFGL